MSRRFASGQKTLQFVKKKGETEKWENSSFSVKYTRKSNFLTAPVAYLDVLGKINITFENASDLPIEINVTSEGSIVRKTYTDHLSDMINTLPYIFG